MKNCAMKLVKCAAISLLCILFGNCPEPDVVYLPDYESNLERWNELNMTDYRLTLEYRDINDSHNNKQAVVYVRNGMPERSDPQEWLEDGEMSTVEDIFSFIMKRPPIKKRTG